MIKAFLYALVLTIEELRKFIDKSRTKQQRTLYVVYYIQSPLASNDFGVRCQGGCSIYLH